MLRNERAIFSRYWYAFLSDRSSRGRDVAAADCDASSYLVGGDCDGVGGLMSDYELVYTQCAREAALTPCLQPLVCTDQ